MTDFHNRALDILIPNRSLILILVTDLVTNFIREEEKLCPQTRSLILKLVTDFLRQIELLISVAKLATKIIRD